MELRIGKALMENNPKKRFRISVDTMTNDADGYNSFTLGFPDNPKGKEEFKEVIRYCEVMQKQYKNGRGGGDGFYDHLDFFEEYFSEEWYYEYGEYMDSWDGYRLSYFDQTGKEFKIEKTLSNEDIEIIDSYEVKT